MERFDFLLVLIGVVLGLGITQILTGFANVIQHRDRVRPYWVQLAWMGLMFLLQVEYWYSIESWRQGPGLGGDFFGYVATLFVPFALYITSVVLVPSIPPTGPFDCRHDYFQNARWTFALATACLVVLTIQKTLHADARWMQPRNAVRGCAILCTAGLAVTKDARVHRVAPFALLGLFAAFAWLWADG